MDIEHWLNDRAAITTFEKDKVYVIEFWATWCGPCLTSIPHLRDLQIEHKDAITVIGVSDESRETIDAFLEREQDGTTFRDITRQYWLATDPDGSVKRDYMRAADQNGIPTAFIVGKSGDIEWIGHPMRMDEPLAQIVAGTWDRESYKRQMVVEQDVREKAMAAAQLARDTRYAEALTALDALIAANAAPELQQALERMRQRIKTESETPASAPQVAQAATTHVEIRRLAIGDQVTLPVTGRANGAVWGDHVYTLDSDIGTAAVHAGLLRVGESRSLRILVVPPPASFPAAHRNGVASMKWGSFPAAFVMQGERPAAVSAGPFTGPRPSGLLGTLGLNESKTISVTGADRGFIWGTDTYPGDFHPQRKNHHALNESIPRVTQAADAVAQGDLTVEVRQRSEHD
ncbi:MAG: redoxin domain-containing protein, partial [Planctomycetia bacterium]